MLVTTQDQLDQIVDDILNLCPQHSVAIDTETSGLHTYQGDYMIGMSLTYPEFHDAEGLLDFYIPTHSPDSTNFDVTRLVEALDATPAEHILHHAEFDWAVLAKETGIELEEHRYWDTQTIDWLLDENQDHRLKEGLGVRYFGVEAKDKKDELKALIKGTPWKDIYRELRAGDDEEYTGRGTTAAAEEEARRRAELTVRTWGSLTAAETHEYAEKDTNLTYNSRFYQAGMIDEWENYQVATDIRPDIEREFQFQRVLYRMMKVGIRVNPVGAEASRKRALDRIAEIEPLFEGVNLGSPVQLAKLIFEEWGVEAKKIGKPTKQFPAGQPSTSKEVLEELEGSHPNVDAILEYRQLTKAVGTYYNALITKRDHADRVHTSFAMNRTVTGRLSSSDPNLQNIPKASTNAEVRAVFVPAPGLELWEYDLKAAEMRVLAGWSKDEALTAAVFDPSIDVHMQTALGVWGEEIVATDPGRYRDIGKNIGYSYPYGIQGRKMAAYLVKGTGRMVTDADVAQGKLIISGYERTYPKLARLMKGVQRQVEQRGYIPLHPPGRFRRYRGAGYRDWKTYTALNSIVQGGIGEFMKDVMMEFEPHELHGGNGVCRMCLQIHDSLVIEVVPGNGMAILGVLQEIADRINPFPLPMEWDAKQWSTK